jgi:hypothetical protein
MSHANDEALVGLWALRDRIEYEPAQVRARPAFGCRRRLPP